MSDPCGETPGRGRPCPPAPARGPSCRRCSVKFRCPHLRGSSVIVTTPRSARAKSVAIACWSVAEPLAASAPATPGRSVSGSISTVPSKAVARRAVVALAEPEHEHQAAGEDEARRGHPSWREGTGGDVTLLPRRRGRDDRTLVELEARPDPPVLADAAREDLQALAARLEHDLGYALRVDRRPHERRRRQLEDDLALGDAVVVFGRERDPLEDIVPGLPLHDATHDVLEDEGVRRVSARGEPPPDAHLRSISPPRPGRTGCQRGARGRPSRR